MLIIVLHFINQDMIPPHNSLSLMSHDTDNKVHDLLLMEQCSNVLVSLSRRPSSAKAGFTVHARRKVVTGSGPGTTGPDGGRHRPIADIYLAAR